MRPLKMLWVDVETTGLDSFENTVHQVAGIVVIDGIEKEEFNLEMRPHPAKKVEEAALRVSNLSIADVERRTLASQNAYKQFNKILCKYVDKFVKADKFVIGAYNANFDAGFLNDWYKLHGNEYFFGLCHGGAYFDPLALALYAEMKAGKRLFTPDRKLVTVCKALGVRLDKAHDALADIRATREVAGKLWKMVAS